MVAQSKQEREERETKHHGTSVQFCTVCSRHLKNTSNLFHMELKYHSAAKMYFEKISSGGKLQM